MGENAHNESKTNKQTKKILLAKSIGEGRSAVCQQVKLAARCRLLATNWSSLVFATGRSFTPPSSSLLSQSSSEE